METEEIRRETLRLAAMTGCLVLVIICSAFAVRAVASMISFTSQPSPNAGEALRTLAIVATVLAAVAFLEVFLGKSNWSAGILVVHAALSLGYPAIWFYTVLPMLVALLVIIIVRMARIGGAGPRPSDAELLR
jgi:hypothetical protein